MSPKHPKIKVDMDLSGPDGNIHIIIRRVRQAMKNAGLGRDEVDEFTRQVQIPSDYHDRLREISRWVTFNEGEYAV